MKASFCLIFLVAVAISANMIAARSKKSHKTEKAGDDALKHRVKSKKIDAEKMKDEAESYWTVCGPEYSNPLGVCDAGYHLTQNPKKNNAYTWSKQVDHIWDPNGHKNTCGPSEVRYFCAQTFTKAYWEGTGPKCDDEDGQVSSCIDAGYQGLRLWTSKMGDGAECSWAGIKVLCAKV